MCHVSEAFRDRKSFHGFHKKHLSDTVITDMICSISWRMCVCVCLQTRTYGLDDGDAYMSSYENRFRLFSSVEYEGQLYMTPLNFIESVTLSEPKSESAPDSQLTTQCHMCFERNEGMSVGARVKWLASQLISYLFYFIKCQD